MNGSMEDYGGISCFQKVDINLAYEHVTGHSEWVDTSKNGSVSAAKEIILGQEPVY